MTSANERHRGRVRLADVACARGDDHCRDGVDANGFAHFRANDDAYGSHWRHLPIRIRQFAEHLRCVHRLDARRRQLELARIVEPHRVFDDEASLSARSGSTRGTPSKVRSSNAGHTVPRVVSPCVSSVRIATEAAAERRAACGNRIVDDDPGHVGLRLDFQVHARDVAARSTGPGVFCCTGVTLARDFVPARQRRLQRNRRDALQRHPRLAVAVLRELQVCALRAATAGVLANGLAPSSAVHA